LISVISIAVKGMDVTAKKEMIFHKWQFQYAGQTN